MRLLYVLSLVKPCSCCSLSDGALHCSDELRRVAAEARLAEEAAIAEAAGLRLALDRQRRILNEAVDTIKADAARLLKQQAAAQGSQLQPFLGFQDKPEPLDEMFGAFESLNEVDSVFLVRSSLFSSHLRLIVDTRWEI